MSKLSNLLSKLTIDETKYYLLKDRDLVTEENFSITQNDNNSTKIQIIMPTILGGFDIDSNYNFYIDYIDGAGKPGVVSNTTQIKKVYESSENGCIDITNKVNISENGTKVTIDNKTFKLSDIENNQFATDDNITYIIETNVQYSTDGNKYYSKVLHQNLEDAAEISPDYPNKYSDCLYFIKSSNNLTAGTTVPGISDDNDLVNYLYVEWTLDRQVTNAAGEVTFSIRIEKADTGFNWQSNSGSFIVNSNLKENYYLKKEVEENFVIQNRIIKPVGNFENILVKGDTNSNKLFYKMNRYYQGQDMLSKRKYQDFELLKSANGVYGYINNSETKILNLIYNINNIAIWSEKTGEVGSFDLTTNSFTVGGKDYNIISLETNYDATLKNYKYKLKLVGIEEPLMFISLNNSTITLDETDYRININAVATDFSELEQTDNTFTGKPVYNRLIRFVFLSPNQEYGDWNDGEIEYVSEKEDYFIFSWTPDARATRSEGQLSYYIEFFINGLEEEVLENGIITTTQSKTYSWSTLPTTITIESNAAATAKVDYIPHWVSYVENNLQDDLDSFLNTDLQSQYDSFQEYLIQSILGDYETPTRILLPFGEKIFINLKETGYYIKAIKRTNKTDTSIEGSKNTHIENILVELYESESTTTPINSFILNELETDSLYGAAIQNPKTEININKITDSSGEISEYEILSDRTLKVIKEIEGGKKSYITKEPLEANKTEYEAFSEDLTKISITVEFQTRLIYNYFVIYNNTNNYINFYVLENKDEITVPFLQYAKENFQNFLNEQQNIFSDKQNKIEILKNNISTDFGVTLDSTQEDSLYTKVIDQFQSLGTELREAYEGETYGGLFELFKEVQGSEPTQISIDEVDGNHQFTIDSTTYIFKGLNAKDGDKDEFCINYGTDKDLLFVPNKFYYKNADDTFVIAERYEKDKEYYKEDKTPVSFNIIEKVDGIFSFILGDITYYFKVSTLRDEIDSKIQNATDELSEQFSKFEEDTKTQLEEEIQNNYNKSLTDLEEQYNNSLKELKDNYSYTLNTIKDDRDAQFDKILSVRGRSVQISYAEGILIFNENELGGGINE